MFCQKCGTQNDDSSVACTNCSNPFVNSFETKTILEDEVLNPSDNQVIEISETGRIKLIPNQHTWKRFIARTIDNSLFILAAELVLSLISDDFANFIQSPTVTYQSFEGLAVSILLLTLYVLFEPISISLFGTTIGKSIFGLRVYTNKGDKLNYGLALKRSFLVFYKGEGFCIPIITLFAMKNAQLLVKETGFSEWDVTCGTMVFKKVK